MSNQNTPSDAIFLSDEEPLTLSPNAPPVTFSTKGNSLQLGETFSRRNLRFKSKHGITALASTEQGHYYRPHWPAFTSFLDCQDRQAIKASTALASLPWNSTAPEIGVPGNPANSILAKQVLSDKFNAVSSSSLIWNTDLPFLAYLKKLPSSELKALLKEEGPSLLEHCLLVCKFMAADFLWDNGVRLSHEQLNSGKALWGLGEPLFLATPSMPMMEAMLKISSFEKEISADEGDISEWLSPWKNLRIVASPNESAMRASLLHMIHSHRWLDRLVDEGINVNATLDFRYVLVDGTEKSIPKRVLSALCENLWNDRNAQMNQSHTIEGYRWRLPEANLAFWFKTMERAGFNWHQPLPSLHADAPISFTDETRRLSLPEPLQDFLREKHSEKLEQTLERSPTKNRNRL